MPEIILSAPLHRGSLIGDVVNIPVLYNEFIVNVHVLPQFFYWVIASKLIFKKIMEEFEVRLIEVDFSIFFEVYRVD